MSMKSGHAAFSVTPEYHFAGVHKINVCVCFWGKKCTLHPNETLGESYFVGSIHPQHSYKPFYLPRAFRGLYMYLRWTVVATIIYIHEATWYPSNHVYIYIYIELCIYVCNMIFVCIHVYTYLLCKTRVCSISHCLHEKPAVVGQHLISTTGINPPYPSNINMHQKYLLNPNPS